MARNMLSLFGGATSPCTARGVLCGTLCAVCGSVLLAALACALVSSGRNERTRDVTSVWARPRPCAVPRVPRAWHNVVSALRDYFEEESESEVRIFATKAACWTYSLMQ